MTTRRNNWLHQGA
jgi:hypothetical protein